MNEIIFDYSESEIKNRNKKIWFLYLLAMVVIIPMMAVNFFLIKLPLDIILISGIISVFISYLTMFFTNFIIKKQLKNTKLIIDAEKIIKKQHKTTETFIFENIDKYKVIKIKNDKILSITLCSNNNYTVINGFNDMDKISNLIESKLNENIKKEIAEKNKDPNSILNILFGVFLGLFLFILIILLTAFIPIIFNLKNPKVFANIMDNLISIIAGLYFLIGKPISKNKGSKFLKSDIILGALLLSISIIRIFLTYL